MTDNVVDLGLEQRVSRAEAAQDASIWTPVDVLKVTLRDIEAGRIEATALAVAWIHEREDRSITGGYRISASSPLQSTFIAEKLKQDLWQDGIS